MATTILPVTITTDEADGSADLGAGLSLRDAIIIALEGAAQDPDEEFIIELEGGQTHLLTLPGSDEDLAATGDLDIFDGANITIRSTSEEDLAIIDAGGVDGLGDRVFEVFAGSSLTLEGVQVTGGNVTGDGGAVLNNGTLTVTGSTIAENTASDDGGGIASFGELIVTSSTIQNNNSGPIVVGNGGGILAVGSLVLTESTITGNTASDNGGGIAIAGSTEVEISNNTITSNTATSNGGGIAITGPSNVEIANNTISANTASANGGGVSITGAASAELSENTISSNTASVSGGGVQASSSGTVAVLESTVASNVALIDGGGINSGTEVTLLVSQSLIDGNSANVAGGGIDVSDIDPGEDPVAIVVNSTIANNVTDADGNGSGLGSIDVGDGDSLILVSSTLLENTGGGINNEPGGNITIANSVVAFSEGADFSGGQPTVFGTNIIADDSLALEGIESVDPATLLFSELQDNGGPTLSFLPLEGNPVIDLGDNDALLEATLGVDFNLDGDPTGTLVTDQRGFNRIFSDIVDIGAVEAGAVPNDPPAFTSPAAVSVVENTTEVLTLTAEDPEGDELSFEIAGGADQAAFAIADPLTGALTFQAAPDFEAPGDADGDNVFEVEVSVTDSINDPVVQALTVTVTDDPADNPDAPIPGAPLNLDVDGVDGVVASVDVLNIFRVLAGAPQAVVVPDGVSQQTVVDTVTNFPALGLDVDESGDVVASVDVLNIFRVLAGAPQAVVIPDNAAVSQQDVVNAVDGLLA